MLRRRRPSRPLAGPYGLRQELRTRRAVRLARASRATARRCWSNPYTQLIIDQAESWVEAYRLWELCDREELAEGCTLTLCGLWRFRRKDLGVWAFETRCLRTGEWRCSPTESWGMPNFKLWPMGAAWESKRFQPLREAFTSEVMRQAVTEVARRLGQKKLPFSISQHAYMVKQKTWGRTQKGTFRDSRVRGGLRVFVAALWKHVLHRNVSGALIAVYGAGAGFSLTDVVGHLASPQRLDRWTRELPNARPLLAALPQSGWPTPKAMQRMLLAPMQQRVRGGLNEPRLTKKGWTINPSHALPRCVSQEQVERLLKAPATLVRAAVRARCGNYWRLPESTWAALETLPVSDRKEVVRALTYSGPNNQSDEIGGALVRHGTDPNVRNLLLSAHVQFLLGQASTSGRQGHSRQAAAARALPLALAAAALEGIAFESLMSAENWREHLPPSHLWRCHWQQRQLDQSLPQPAETPRIRCRL